MKLLVIEDSERLRRSLTHGLTRSGFAVDAVADGRDGLHSAALGDYDLVVLDLMLPGLDGLSVLRRLREGGSDVHVLVLSAKDRTTERIEGLHGGADDYLTKPFEFDELLARVHALLRRRHGRKNPRHELGPLTVDTARRVVEGPDGPLDLTRIEFALLEQLLATRGRALSKQELLDRLYGTDDCASPNAIEVYVHQLRRKLRAAGGDHLLRTRRGFGYVID